jgi:hypothetical protein
MREYWGSGYSTGGGGGGGGGGGTQIPVYTEDALLAGQLVTFVTMGSPAALPRVRLADADMYLAPSQYDICGVALANASAGSSTVIFTGMGSTYSVLFLAAPSSTANGSRVWLSKVSPGYATLTPPGNGGWAQSFVGILQGGDGSTTTPKVLFQPRTVSLLP